MSVSEITVDELATRLSAPGAMLFDVRQPDEYYAGHVPSAVLVPLNEIPDRIADFPREGTALMICRSGGAQQDGVRIPRAARRRRAERRRGHAGVDRDRS